jgi:hypothetical protein
MTITSIAPSEHTVAVLSSSLSKAISPKISPVHNSATCLPQMEILTLHDFNIYPSPLDSSDSIIIISQLEYSLISQLLIIFFTISLLIP